MQTLLPQAVSYCKAVRSQEELERAKIDIGYRDFCAHLLIPLNACRRDNFYLPWRCQHERHAYEKCQYFDYKRRVAKKTEQNEQKKAQKER